MMRVFERVLAGPSPRTQPQIGWAENALPAFIPEVRSRGNNSNSKRAGTSRPVGHNSLGHKERLIGTKQRRKNNWGRN